MRVREPSTMNEAPRNATADFQTFGDDALIRLVAEKSTRAFKILYERYSRRVFGFALRSVQDPETAEEVAIDVFMEVWKSAPGYLPGRVKVLTWIIAICRHRAIDALRRRSSRFDGRALSWDDLPLGTIPSGEPTTESAAERELRREEVRRAIAQLPEEQSAALSLAFFKGYTHKEIAEALSEPLGTIKTRVRLAMKKLKDLLDAEE